MSSAGEQQNLVTPASNMSDPQPGVHQNAVSQIPRKAHRVVISVSPVTTVLYPQSRESSPGGSVASRHHRAV